MFILAFEANSALSRENETKIVKITHSAAYWLKSSSKHYKQQLTSSPGAAIGDEI